MSEATVRSFGTEAEEKAYWLGREDAKREAVAQALTPERLARALIHDDVDDSTFHAAPTPGNIAAFMPRARRILRWLADDDYRPTADEWDDDAALASTEEPAPTEPEAER